MSFYLELEADVFSGITLIVTGFAHGSMCVCFCKQDVGTVYRTAVATFLLLDSPTDIQPTCTASGEYLSHQGKRYEHMEKRPRCKPPCIELPLYLSEPFVTFGLNSYPALLVF